MKRAMRTLDWIAIAWLTLIVSLAGLIWLFPPSFWFEVRRVEVLSQLSDRGFHVIAVDREIHRRFAGKWYATVRSLPGNTVVCQGSGGTVYQPGADLPKPVDMRWWLDDPDCHPGGELRPGEYYLSTTWTIVSPFGFLPSRAVTVDSNVFTVPGAEK